MSATGLASNSQAAFPGANGRIAFVDGGDGGLATMNPDGTNRRVLTSSPRDAIPAYSPDAKRIAFVCEHRDVYGICTVNSDGSHRRRLTGQRVNATDPAFSPDGQQIVFSRTKGHGFSNIWAMNADGSHRHELLHKPGNDWNPSYSPDGRQIVFERVHQVSGDISVDVMNADGTGLHELTTHPKDIFSGWPEFSPNGRQIVYGRFNPHYLLGVWLMGADGSHQHELTPPDTNYAADPAFSPNGQKIVFDGDGRHYHGIYLMRANGSHIHRLSNSSKNDDEPAWGVRP